MLVVYYNGSQIKLKDMSYKDETFLDKVWGFRYSLVFILLFVIGYKLGDLIAPHYDSWSIMPAIGPIVSIVLWFLIYRFKLLK